MYAFTAERDHRARGINYLCHNKLQNWFEIFFFNLQYGNFPSGPVVKNLLCNAGDAGLIPGGRTKIPNAAEQLSLHAKITEAHTLLDSQCITGKIMHDKHGSLLLQQDMAQQNKYINNF